MGAVSEQELEELLEDIRNYLDVTWDDPKGDLKLKGMITRGMAALSGKLGECNFLGETQERTLLFQLVMYEYSGELTQFWTNYKNDIISLQVEKKVNEYAKSQKKTL